MDDTSVLYGRKHERAAVDRAIRDARANRSSALVVRGELGIGKTALLEHVVALAPDLTVLRATGVEAEMELSFAGLHQLLRPIMGHIEALPAPQAAALRTALGLLPGRHDRFLISAAVLSLLAEACGGGPMLVTVDDAQWLDRASADTLVFAARRVHSEGIVLLFAARDDARRRFDAIGVREVRLGGLDDEAAASLLEAVAGIAVPATIRRYIVEATGGNPLALREVATALTPAQLGGRVAMPDPLPVGRRVGQAFLLRARGLSSDARTLLLVAAAEDRGDVDSILRAAAELECESSALADCEAAGLVIADDATLRFSHPLVRSVLYDSASGAQRRAAHAALAVTFDVDSDPDRRAWHRAASTVGHDGRVADELERSAERALQRGGYAAAAAALERAADLTVERQLRGRRLVTAADAAFRAGRAEHVDSLLDKAAPLVADASVAADVELLRGQLERVGGTMSRAHDILSRGAARVAPVDPGRALAMYTAAGLAAWGRNDQQRLASAAAAITEYDPDLTTPTGLAAHMIPALASVVSDDAAGAAVRIGQVVAAAELLGRPYELAMAGAGASFIGDDAGSLRLFARAADAARSQGAVSDLVNMLAAYAAVEAWTGRMRSATAHATEGLTLAAQTGQHTYEAVYHATLAWLSAIKGDADECDHLAAMANRAGAEQEFTPATSLATWARGLSALAAGRPAEAHSRLAQLVDRDSDVTHPTVAVAATGDIVEAAVMAGSPSSAFDAIDALERFTTNTHSPWGRALAARCRGIVDDGDVDSHFCDALDHHATGTRPFEHARTRLSYGAWLRRHRRRMDARDQLRGALDIFERLGARPWEARTRAELRASGEAIGGRDPAAIEQLTPQELQIVQILRTGATNKQIAARLYLSPRTIDYHLRKVFTKLGLSSRVELIALAGQDPELNSTV